MSKLNEYKDMFFTREVGEVTISYKIEGEPCPYQTECCQDKCSVSTYSDCNKIGGLK